MVKAKISDSTLHGAILILVIFTTLTALIQLQAWIRFRIYKVEPHNVFPDTGKATIKFVDFTDLDGNESFHRYLKIETLALGFHVFPSILWGASALVQFSSMIRKKFMLLHRISGYAMIFTSILMTMGVIGMMITDNVIFTLPIKHWLIFTLLPLVYVLTPWFVYTVVRGLLAVWNRNIPEHKRWMSRHMAAGLSVGLQRVFLGIFGLFFKFASPALNELLGQDLFLTENHLTEEYRRIGFSYTMWAGAIICIIGMEWQLRPSSVTASKSKSKLQ